MFDRTVDFDDLNSWKYFGIVFESVSIGSPSPQLILIDVPFRNGPLDETDYFGDVTYKERTIKMDFLIPWYAEDHHGIYSKVLNKLNGKRRKIRFSADQEWYYEGRLQVGEFSHDGDFWKFSIDATADPYKYKDISVSYGFSSPKAITLYNDIMRTVPVFTSDNSFSVIFEENSFTFPEGRSRSTGILLREGNNYLSVTPNGPVNMTIDYRIGRL